MIYITGDTHGILDISKLTTDCFPEQHQMTRDDYLIIAGDFGGVWCGNWKDHMVLDFHDHQSYTTLFIDGNHENFDALEKYPVDEWNGGKVQFIRPNVIHLMRGQVYTIDGRKFFTFGGAQSVDKEYREEFLSWWKQELSSFEEVEEGIKNLIKHAYEVDFVITHTCPSRYIEKLNANKIEDPVSQLLDRFEEIIKFKKWIFGHFHCNVNLDDKFIAIYDQIIRLT